MHLRKVEHHTPLVVNMCLVLLAAHAGAKLTVLSILSQVITVRDMALLVLGL